MMKNSSEPPNEPVARRGPRRFPQEDPSLLQTILDSLTHPFYVIDAGTRQLRLANRAAKKMYVHGGRTCHAMTHGRSEPCDGAEHPCPVRIVSETKGPTVVEHVHYDLQGRRRNVEVHAFPIFNVDGDVTQVIEYCIDVTEQRQVAEKHEWELAVNRALVSLADALLDPAKSLQEIADVVLAGARQLTESEHGYVSSVDPETADMISHTLTHMMGPSCRVPENEQDIVFHCGPNGRYPGLWGHSLNTGEGFYTDAPAQHKAAKGLPEGHIALENFLSVPAMIGEKIVGQIALANSRRGYAETDLAAINHMAKLYALALQRTHADNALKASEERYALAQKAARVGSWDWNMVTNTLLWSEHVGPIFGVTSQPLEMTIQAFLERVHPNDRQRIVDSIDACITRNQEYRIEHRVLWPDSTERWVLETGDVVRNGKGDPVRMLGVVQDITEQKRAELQIRDLAKFPSENPWPVLRIRRDGTVLYSNRPGQILMRAWNTQPGQPLPEQWYQRIRQVIELERTRTTEVAAQGRLFSLVLVPVSGANYVNIYGRDVTAQKLAERQIHDLNRDLELRVQKRTAELTTANARLREEFKHRRLLERELLEISEKEQRRIGQELHDSLGQQLTGIAIMTKVLEKKLQARCPAEAIEAGNIAQLINQAIDETRQLSRGLHPVALDEDGLMSALEGLTATTDTVFRVACTFRCLEPVRLNDVTTAGHLYRIAQEAVTNAIRHGQTQAIVIELIRENDQVTLKVTNDGRDFPKVLPRGKGIGLQVMRHRAEMIDGTLTVGRAPTGGTQVLCTCDMKHRTKDRETKHGIQEPRHDDSAC